MSRAPAVSSLVGMMELIGMIGMTETIGKNDASRNSCISPVSQQHIQAFSGLYEANRQLDGADVVLVPTRSVSLRRRESQQSASQTRQKSPARVMCQRRRRIHDGIARRRCHPG